MLTLGGFPGHSLLQPPLSLLLPHFSLPYTGSVLRPTFCSCPRPSCPGTVDKFPA